MMSVRTEEISQPAQSDTETSPPRNGKRIAARRRGRSRLASRFGWRSGWGRLLAAFLGAAVLVLLAAAVWKAKSMLWNNPHFLVASDQNIEVVGNRIVPTPEVLAVFAPDLGSSLFEVPLAKRQAELDQILWVDHATVMRLWPNRLRIHIEERTPVAFALDGNQVRLVDREGVLLDLPEGVTRHYTFPVLRGVTSAETPQERALQIAAYEKFEQALDAGGGDISATLSEVDLSDPDDVRAVFMGKPPLPVVHFGTSLFLARYRAYKAHLTEWVQRYPHLRSVDMRYGKQVILDTGTEDAPGTSSPAASAATKMSKPATGSTQKPARSKSGALPPSASIADHLEKQTSRTVRPVAGAVAG